MSGAVVLGEPGADGVGGFGGVGGAEAIVRLDQERRLAVVG